MKQIYIIPFAGLCNRMRAIASGVCISQHYGCPATIYWNNSFGLKADFSNLFQPIIIPNVRIEENKRWLFSIGDTRDYLLRWPILKILYHTFFNFTPSKGDVTQLIHLGKKQPLLISCYSMGPHYPLGKLFVPKKDITEKINAIVGKYSANTIGVHIRRTDNKKAIGRSPISAFTALMNDEIKKDDSVSFYVASDDEKTKEDLKLMFPNRIITMPQKADRNSIEGMKNAVTELFCLSKTRMIIGSGYSSYSEIAAEIGGISLVYAKQKV